MHSTNKLTRNKTCGKSVNPENKLKYQKKFPKNTKVLIKNKSQNRFSKDSSSGEFKTIIKQIYSEIEQNSNQISKENIEDNINNLSPKKHILYNTNTKDDKMEIKKVSAQNSDNINIEKAKERIRKKKVKINPNINSININTINTNNINNNFLVKDKENEEYFAQLDERFTQISIIKPNKNDNYSEQSSDKDINNEEYIYFYEPKKDCCNSSKREIKKLFDCIKPQNKLIFKSEICFMINGIGNKEKIKYELKCKELIEKEEKYDKLINNYNALLKELNDLKNKNTITSELTRSDERIVEHLENIEIIKDYITIQDDTYRDSKETKDSKDNNTIPKENKTTKKGKIKRLKRKRQENQRIRNVSSSEETKTRDNSVIHDKKCIPNIMIISKENQFNFAAIKKDETIKTKKKIKKIIKKNNENKNKWNLCNEIICNNSFNYKGIENKFLNINNINTVNDINIKLKKNNDNKNKQTKNGKRRILKKKAITNIEIVDKSNDKNRPTSINEIRKKVKKLKINLPIINVKNETMQYNIQKKYIRFSSDKKTFEYKYSPEKYKNKKYSQSLSRCLSESLSIKKNSNYKNNNIIVKKINLNIINNYHSINNKIEDKESEINNTNNTDYNAYIKEKNDNENKHIEDNSINIKDEYYINEDKNNKIEKEKNYFERPILINKDKESLLKRKKNKINVLPINDITNNIIKVLKKILLRHFFSEWKKIYNIYFQNIYGDKNIINNISENKELSLISGNNENSNFFSEDEKHLLKEKKFEQNYKSKICEKKNEQKDKNKGYNLRIRIVKFGNKRKKSGIYFSVLFKNLVNKILIKRVFKKWLKLTKK